MMKFSTPHLRGNWRGAALGLALVLGIAVAGPAMAQGKLLKFVPEADLRSLDPIWTTAYITRNHGYMVYDVLFATDANFKVQPQMVDKYEVSKDNLTYTFTLRDGLKFHDGAPVRSADCIASIERWAKRDVFGQRLGEQRRIAFLVGKRDQFIRVGELLVEVDDREHDLLQVGALLAKRLGVFGLVPDFGFAKLHFYFG